MKKYSFLIYHADYMDFLQKLREAGVLHVIEKSTGIADDPQITDNIQLLNVVKSLSNKIDKLIVGTSVTEKSEKNADRELIDSMNDKFNEVEILQSKINALENEYNKMLVWGDFSHDLLEKIENEGIFIGFYTCRNNRFKEFWYETFNAQVIGEADGQKFFVTITRQDGEVDIDAEKIVLSDRNAAEIKEEINLLSEEKKQLQKTLIHLANKHYSDLQQLKLNTLAEIDLRKVVLHSSAEAEEKVMLLEGWCPEDHTQMLEKMLDDENVYYQTAKPEENENVPVKLKNNKFARLYEVIGDLYDLPDYHEVDLTPFFAPFFMLFFGLCLGDAAYGLLFIVAAVFLRKKAKPAMKSVFELMIWLGSATVVMGIITGTFLGFSLVDAPVPFLEGFKKYMLDADKLFYVSLILGAVQILYGMIIKAIGIVIRFGWTASLSIWGWLILLIGGGGSYALSYFSVLQPQIATLLYYVFGGIAFLLIFLLNNINRNPLINIGAGLWDTYNMATGLLGDVLSYIRLFALGISGSVMGFVFNDLAIKLSGDIPVISPLIMILIMIIGHGINIFMSALGAFVHPLRLTFVEFYKNAGFQGGGKKYKPFTGIYEQNQ